MKNHLTLLACLSVSACVSTNQSTLEFQAIDPSKIQSNLDNTPLLVGQFSSLCLNTERKVKQIIEDANLSGWKVASKEKLKKEDLGRLKKQTLIIPGGGAPVEETQNILIKSFEDENFILEISQRFDRKQLTTNTCTIYGKQSEFLKNCSSLGELIKRAPDQNTKYKESDAHFIGWNASLSNRPARIKCQHTPNSPTLPYDGTQLSVSVDHVTPLKPVKTKKSSPQQSDVSAR